MDLKLEIFNALCSTKEFYINGIMAESEDFGDKADMGTHPPDADEYDRYGCIDMQFTPKPATQEVLDRYNITKEEYDEIACQLAEGLSFGNCGWCI